MIESRVDDRANTAGAVGQYLKGRLNTRIGYSFSLLPFSAQITSVYQSTWYGTRPTPLDRAALSFLCSDVAVQVPLPESAIWSLIDATCPVPDLGGPGSRQKWRWALQVGPTVKQFPLKSNPAASNKTNLYFNEVATAMARLDGTSFRLGLYYLQHVVKRRTVYNDQATAYLLYGFCLSRYSEVGWRLAAAALDDPDYHKGLSIFLKAVGANGTRVGALCVEGIVLQGRDAVPVDLKAEARKRVDKAAVAESAALYPEDDLRREILTTLKREIKREGSSYLVDFPTYEEHWDSRWAWAVNGAHSNLLSHYNRVPTSSVPGVARLHRRAWLETIEDDPRPAWDGNTAVSASPKLEHGKTRAIFACDTVNYLAFEHLISPVERRWRGERVILNPGKGGHLGMASRVMESRGRSGVSLMLDYDDFNSQHTTRAMQILVEELCNLVGYDPLLRDRLVASFDKQHIYVGGVLYGTAQGTLMSGHRLTTFINSVLNEVYLALALSREFLDKQRALHVGDDVYLGVSSYSEASHVVKSILHSPLRMNPAKQSVGHVSTEFLRVATAGRYCYSYLSRCVASITSGNWANELALAPSEALTSLLASARSLANRSGLADVALLLVPSVRRLIGAGSSDDHLLRDLLTGRLALGNGPQFQSSGSYRQVAVTETSGPQEQSPPSVPLYATRRYLATQASEIEVKVLTRAGVSVEGSMSTASWSKTLTRPSPHTQLLTFGPVTVSPCVGLEWAEVVLRRPKAVGVLSAYPLLTLARNRLREPEVRYAIALAGGNPNTPWLDYEAWGEYKHGCVIDTPMSYSDAAALGSRTSVSVLTASLRMCV